MAKRIIENQFLGIEPEISREQLRQNLLPGDGNSGLQYGYLGLDEDQEKVIEDDFRLLSSINLTYDQIATAIEELFANDSDEEFRGSPIIPRKNIHSPVCPWRDYCAVSVFDYSVKITEIIVVNRNKVDECIDFLENIGGVLTLQHYPDLVKRDLAMIFSDLHPHLIREHHFFEGHATPYRIQPEKVAHFLNI